jgi:hypothetical protein
MGTMTGSGECWSGDCDHPAHLSCEEKIEVLKLVVRDAIEGDRTKDQLGHGWHEEAQKALKL